MRRRSISLNAQNRSPDRPGPQRFSGALALMPEWLDLEEFRMNLYAAHPELRAQRGEAEPLRLDQISLLLHDSASALIEYVVGEDKIYLFVITKSDARSGMEIRSYTAPVNWDELKRDQASGFQYLITPSNQGRIC